MRNEFWSGGVLISAEELPDPEPDVVVLDPVLVAAQAIREEIGTRLAPSSVNTIVEVKAAITEGLDAVVERLST